VYQIQNGLPYTLQVDGDDSPGGAVAGINGSNGSNRIDVLGNNSFRQPLTWLLDMRIAKNFAFSERYKLELMADFFNIANKQNVMGVNQNGYFTAASGTVPTPTGSVTCTAALPCLDFFDPTKPATVGSTFGTTTSVNNSNFLYTPRQIQLGLRVHF